MFVASQNDVFSLKGRVHETEGKLETPRTSGMQLVQNVLGLRLFQINIAVVLGGEKCDDDDIRRLRAECRSDGGYD